MIDCFGNSEGESDIGPVAEWHQRIIDQVVEVNEKVMDRYLDLGEGGLSGEELHDAFEQCLREGHLVPVCFVSARTGAEPGTRRHTSRRQGVSDGVLRGAPGSSTTNLVFGGADRRVCYVTDSTHGRILRATLDVPGLPLHRSRPA